jgi:hypothetical protein
MEWINYHASGSQFAAGMPKLGKPAIYLYLTNIIKARQSDLKSFCRALISLSYKMTLSGISVIASRKPVLISD